MEKTSIVKIKMEIKSIYRTECERQHPSTDDGEDMPYDRITLAALVVARLTGWKISRAYSVVKRALAVTNSTITRGRRSRGKSDKSPR